MKTQKTYQELFEKLTISEAKLYSALVLFQYEYNGNYYLNPNNKYLCDILLVKPHTINNLFQGLKKKGYLTLKINRDIIQMFNRDCQREDIAKTYPYTDTLSNQREIILNVEIENQSKSIQLEKAIFRTDVGNKRKRNNMEFIFAIRSYIEYRMFEKNMNKMRISDIRKYFFYKDVYRFKKIVEKAISKQKDPMLINGGYDSLPVMITGNKIKYLETF